METWLRDIFSRIEPIQLRKMFGGYGVFKDGLMFALVADESIYLKSDKQSDARYIDMGLKPFEYDKNGKAVQMSYWEAPDVIYEDPDEAGVWANFAIEAAIRAKKK